jgi:hypothetical protein
VGRASEEDRHDELVDAIHGAAAPDALDHLERLAVLRDAGAMTS